MGKQIHYVVVADLDSGTWWIDDEYTRLRLEDGTWNTETEDWEETTKPDYSAGLKILDANGRES